MPSCPQPNGTDDTAASAQLVRLQWATWGGTDDDRRSAEAALPSLLARLESTGEERRARESAPGGGSIQLVTRRIPTRPTNMRVSPPNTRAGRVTMGCDPVRSATSSPA